MLVIAYCTISYAFTMETIFIVIVYIYYILDCIYDCSELVTQNA